jgi:hypothetical protein
MEVCCFEGYSVFAGQNFYNRDALGLSGPNKCLAIRDAMVYHEFILTLCPTPPFQDLVRRPIVS